MKNDSRFWDRIANRYHRSPIKDPDAYEQKLDITRRLLKTEHELLEFGCGTGGTAIAHAPHVRHVHAIDISEQMLQFARRHAAAHKVNNVSFEKSGIEQFDSRGKRYDVILGLSILHLVKDRNAVLKKVFQLLKPGGVFISSTACMGDNLGMLKYVMPIGQVLGVLPTIKVFTQTELVDNLRSCGFSVAQQWRPQMNMAAFIVAERQQVEQSAAERHTADLQTCVAS